MCLLGHTYTERKAISLKNYPTNVKEIYKYHNKEKNDRKKIFEADGNAAERQDPGKFIETSWPLKSQPATSRLEKYILSSIVTHLYKQPTETKLVQIEPLCQVDIIVQGLPTVIEEGPWTAIEVEETTSSLPEADKTSYDYLW